MSTRTFWLCGGLAGGVLLTLLVQYAIRRPEEGPRAAPPREAPELAALRTENQRLRDEVEAQRARGNDAEAQAALLADKVANLESAVQGMRSAAGAAPETVKAPAAPPTDEELMEGVGKFGESLGAVLRGGGDGAKKELRELLARAGKHGIDLLVAKFEDGATDIGLRSVLAHALAQSGNPETVATLTKILANPEAGMLELRLATHGLAFSDAPGIDDSLLAVAHRSADTGARANAAFGLARRKHPEGVGLYAKATDEAMANRDPAGLQYLSGFFLLGDDGLPPMRERLLTYTEPQTVITLIELLKMKGDKGALPNLRKLAADQGKPEAIRTAADGAIKALGGG